VAANWRKEKVSVRLDELTRVYGECHAAMYEWAQKRGSELDDVIRRSRNRDGAVAMEILEAVPSSSINDEQVDALFEAVSFWIQGPSSLYSLAIRVMVKHAKILLTHLQRGFIEACTCGDDSLVRGFCHAISLVDIEVQTSLKKGVASAFAASSNPHVREAIRDLAERSPVFHLDD
jgi:hypothetical protein